MSLEDIISAVEQDSTLRDGQGSDEQPPSEQDAPTSAQPSDLGGLGALLSQPELMARIPALLRIVQTMTEPPDKGECKRPDSPVALLTALRPYLNDHRRQALDTMIRISRLGDSLKSLH